MCVFLSKELLEALLRDEHTILLACFVDGALADDQLTARGTNGLRVFVIVR